MADEQTQTPKAARNDDGMEQDRLARLPDDVAADVLRRVPPCGLAAARCVSKAWRHTVDSSRLLRSDLLPLSLAGLFIHFEKHKYPEYFARPSSTARAVSGDLSFLPSASSECCYYWEDGFVPYNIQNHCNGLVLVAGDDDYYVVNPATRRWHTLPACPYEHTMRGMSYEEVLVYDPMRSPYYKVFRIPTLDDDTLGEEIDPSMEGCEWPPSICKMYVFSSESGRWDEKDFVREGDAAGTVPEIRAGYSEFKAIYFREALYVQCGDIWFMRVSLSNDTYSAIKPPTNLEAEGYLDTSIARSEKGVYFLALDKYWLRVWILNESSSQTEWILKHDRDLKPLLGYHRLDQQVCTPWVLEDINYNLFRSSHSSEDNNKSRIKDIFTWNSDSEDGSENEEMVEHCGSAGNTWYYGDLELLGFHPYKEVVFLSASALTGLAYHMNGSRIEVLGSIYPKEYYSFKESLYEGEGFTFFPYTPCWIEEF